MFKENMNLKIIALLLSLFVWLQSALVTEQKATIMLPLSLVNIPKNVSFNNLPSKVPIIVKGKGLNIIRLWIHKTKLEVDVANIKPGLAELAISDYNINIPENLDITVLGLADDKELMVQSEVFHRKTVPVELSFTDNNVKKLLESKDYKFFPDQIQLFGPRNMLQKINSITTEKINRNMLSQRDLKVKLVSPDDDISLSENSIRINIMDEASISRVINNIPIKTNTMHKISPSRVTVIVKGTVTAIQNLKIEQISASLEGSPDSDGAFKVVVSVPDELVLLDITPAKVYLVSND